MKKLIAGFMTILMMLLTIASPVLASSEPCVIALDIKTVPPEAAVGLTIVLKQEGVAIIQGNVNEYKEMVFEVSQIIGVECTSFEAVIVECEDNAACHKTVAFNPSGYITWDITAVDVPCPACPTCPICPTCPSCPACPTTTTISETYCTDNGFILPEECETCTSIEVLITALVAFFGLGYLVSGEGYKVILGRDKSGKKKVKITQHKHKVSPSGIPSYHSIYTIHFNPDYRHESGKVKVPSKWL